MRKFRFNEDAVSIPAPVKSAELVSTTINGTLHIDVETCAKFTVEHPDWKIIQHALGQNLVRFGVPSFTLKLFAEKAPCDVGDRLLLHQGSTVFHAFVEQVIRYREGFGMWAVIIKGKIVNQTTS